MSTAATLTRPCRGQAGAGIAICNRELDTRGGALHRPQAGGTHQEARHKHSDQERVDAVQRGRARGKAQAAYRRPKGGVAQRHRQPSNPVQGFPRLGNVCRQDTAGDEA